jgi:hypothetical protein
VAAVVVNRRSPEPAIGCAKGVIADGVPAETVVVVDDERLG